MLFYCDSDNIPTSQFDTFVTWKDFESGKSAFTFLSNYSLICWLFHRTRPRQLLLPSAPPHPSPDMFPSFARVELGDQKRKNKMAPYHDGYISCRATNGKHGFCKKVAWSFSSVTYYRIDNLAVIKRTYFIFNKKADVCV